MVFLFGALTVSAVVKGPVYVELPLLLVAGFAWKHIRRWLGIERVVREEALLRRQEESTEDHG